MKKLVIAVSLVASLTAQAQVSVSEIFNYFKTTADIAADHFTNSTAHATLFSGKVDTNHTGNVTLNNDLSVGGALSVTGLATFGTNATSSVDYLTTTPSARDLVTAEWVRGLAMSGAEWYFTSTVTNGFGEKTANLVALSDMIPATAFTNQIASPVPASSYLVGGVTTNTYTALRSPVTLDAYLSRQGGNTSTVIPVHPEIYYVYNGTTNQLGDWEVANQNVTSISPTRFTWVVAFQEPAITGSVRVVAYMKSGTPTGTASGLNIYGGGIYSSHLDIQNIGVIAESDPIWESEKSNYITNNQPMSITFTNLVTMNAGALGGTNGVYFTQNGTNYWIFLQ